MGDLLDQIVRDISEHGQMKLEVGESDRERLLKAALCLTLKEAENAFARAMVQRGALSSGELAKSIHRFHRLLMRLQPIRVQPEPRAIQL